MSIIFEKLTHIYDVTMPTSQVALHEVDLTIKEGTFTAVIGETGSGKTTLVQHINALLIPSSGIVKVDDFIITNNKKENKNLKALRKKVGVVFQFPEYQLFEETILKDIIFGPKNFGMNEEEAIEKAKEVIKLVGLDESYLEKNPFNLSGGQKRRIAIAGILAADPDILVLDEPTAGLDPKGAKEMMDLFETLNKKYNKTIIMVTHDMEHVFQYCNQVVVMKNGLVDLACSTNTFFKNIDYLKKMSIKLPFIIETKELLKKNGIYINKQTTSLKSLVKQIQEEVDNHG